MVGFLHLPQLPAHCDGTESDEESVAKNYVPDGIRAEVMKI
jgi:hypothetical protein